MRRFYRGEVDRIYRQLARHIHKNVKTSVPEMNLRMLYRLDRFGRGRHRSFNDWGLAGIRIMEAHENYTQQQQQQQQQQEQHQDIRTENGINYADTFEHVNFGYARKLTDVNAGNLASLAWFPPAPKEVFIVGFAEVNARLKWSAVAGVKECKIY
jgi:hypothetical protein